MRKDCRRSRRADAHGTSAQSGARESLSARNWVHELCTCATQRPNLSEPNHHLDGLAFVHRTVPFRDTVVTHRIDFGGVGRPADTVPEVPRMTSGTKTRDSARALQRNDRYLPPGRRRRTEWGEWEELCRVGSSDPTVLTTCEAGLRDGMAQDGRRTPRCRADPRVLSLGTLRAIEVPAAPPLR